jgi:hypothetical protein
MRRFLPVLLLLSAVSASAAATITSVSPSSGFVYGYTTVTLTGTDLTPVDFTCKDNEPCPMTVLFGTVPGNVRSVTSTRAVVLAPPQPHGTRVAITLRLAGLETTLANAFVYDNFATVSRDDYVQYLIPVTGQHKRGSNGSLWTTEWTIFNGSQWHLTMIWAHCAPNVSPCPSPTIAPRTTARHGSYASGFDSDGGFVYVPKQLVPYMSSSLRVRDISGGANNFGAEVPFVRVGRDYTNQERGVHVLVDIPTDPKYRVTLRIYGEAEAPHTAYVTIYGESSDVPLERHDVELNGIVNVAFDPFPLRPAYAEIDPLSPAVRASGERIRIAVGAQYDFLISPPLVRPIYAFVSVTNNETQQVTTITPHR